MADKVGLIRCSKSSNHAARFIKSDAHLVSKIPEHDSSTGSTTLRGCQTTVICELVLGIPDIKLGSKFLQNDWHLKILLCCLLSGINPGPACSDVAIDICPEPGGALKFMLGWISSLGGSTNVTL